MSKDESTETRLTRIETRLSRFMVALGVDPHGERRGLKVQRIRLRSDFRLEVTTLDVSLLDLMQFITSKNLAAGEYTVLHNGVAVATIVVSQ